MRAYFLLKDFFSLLNIGLILFLLLINKEKKNIKEFISVRKIVGLLFISAMRLLENRMQVHVLYVYLTVVIVFFILGYLYESNNMIYDMLVAGIFLLIVSFSQVVSGTIGYILTEGRQRLFLLPPDGQIGLLAIAEISIIVGVCVCVRIIKKYLIKFRS